MTVAPSDFGTDLADQTCWEMIYALPLVANYYHDHNDVRAKVELDAYLDDTRAMVVLVDHVHQKTNTGVPLSVSASGVDGWGAGVLPYVFQGDAKGWEILEQWSEDAPELGIIVGHVRLKIVVDSGEGNCYGFRIATLYDDGYTETDTGARKCEQGERTTAANKVYKDYAPASSWLLSRGLSHTLNKITFESRQVFSCPIFGDYSAP